MTMFWRSWILSFWPQPLSPLRGSDWGLWSKITFDMFHIYYTSWHKFWHLDPSVGRGESAGKIFPTMLLHLWFFFNLICNRTMFWTSWILTYWPQGLGWGGLPAKYLLPFCCIGDILKFNMQYVYVLKNVVFWHLDPQCWRGGGESAGKIFPIMLLHVWFLLIWYATWPYFEEVEFWALDPTT